MGGCEGRGGPGWPWEVYAKAWVGPPWAWLLVKAFQGLAGASLGLALACLGLAKASLGLS